jgi:RHS repeat-associated protein
MGRIIKTQKTVLPVVLPGRPTKYLTQSTYDDAGRIASIKYPDNKVIKYAYNGPVLDRVYDLQNVYAAYSGYNALGQPAQMTSGNGVVTNYSYSNAANPDCPEHNFRPCKTKTQGAAGAYQDFRYRYDRGGNILSIDDVINGNQAFQYDELSRLLSATGTYGTITYAYDQIGNLLCNSQISPCTAGSPNYVYPPSGANSIRPHAATRVGTRDFTYDPNGNMLNGSGRTLTYDTENRLVQAATAQGDTSFIYDGNGGRVMKLAGVSTTTYIGKLYECTDGQCIKYIFAGDQRIARKMVDNNIIHYYHSDHLGSSSAVTDAAGNRVQNLAYFPFGETREQSGTVDVHHKYTGQELDDSTDLYFYGARYYDAGVGKFITPDTVVQAPYDPHTLNRYSYVRNNPLKYTDPSGHSFSLKRTWRKIEKQSARTKLFRHFGHWYDANVGKKIKRFCERNSCNGGYQYDYRFGGGDPGTSPGEPQADEPTYSQPHPPSISPPSTPNQTSRTTGERLEVASEGRITVGSSTAISPLDLDGLSSKDMANAVFTVQGIFLTLLQWTAQATLPAKIPWWAFAGQTSLPAIGSVLTSSHPLNTVESVLGTGLGFVPGGQPFSVCFSCLSMVPADVQGRAAQTITRSVRAHPILTYWIALPFDPVGLGAVYLATQE